MNKLTHRGMQNRPNPLLALVLALALFAVAPPSLGHENRQALVYHPADLTHPDGRQSLLKRIHDMARLTCPRYGRVRELAEINRCQRAAVSDLIRQINDREFTAFAQNPDGSIALPEQLVLAH